MFAKFEMHAAAFVQAIAPVAVAGDATVNGITLDQRTLNNEGGPFSEALFLLQVGAISGSPTGFSAIMEIQDSADGSTWADVTDTNTLVEAASVTLAAANTKASLGVRLKGLRRYVRASVVVDFTAGTSPATVISAACVLGGAARI